jgi:hypothetical protein
MERASELVLGKGKKTRTDAQIVRFPDRYADKGGIVMWQKVMAQLGKLASANQTSLIEPALVSCK